MESVKPIIHTPSLTLSVTSVTGKPHLDGKQGLDVNDVSSHFKFQPLSDSCYTTCIYNVLKGLAVAHANPGISFPEHRVNKLCGYKQNFGPNLSAVVPHLTEALKSFGYVAQEQIPTTYGGLVKIIADQKSSYPLIGFKYQYLVDCRAAQPLAIANPPDHVVIVLSCNESETVLFDPFGAHIRGPQGNLACIGRGLYLMATSNMTDYWENAYSDPWAFWIYRKTKDSSINMRLDEYTTSEASQH